MDNNIIFLLRNCLLFVFTGRPLCVYLTGPKFESDHCHQAKECVTPMLVDSMHKQEHFYVKQELLKLLCK